MKLFILSLFSYLSSTLAIPAPGPRSSTSPNILQASYQLLPSFDRDQCCQAFRQIWGTTYVIPSLSSKHNLTLFQFSGLRHCDGACVCDWLGTNIANASYGTPWTGASSDTPDKNWSWCTHNCVPSYSFTLSLPLSPWIGTSWVPTNTDTAFPTSTLTSTGSARATPFDNLISTVMVTDKDK